MMIAGYTFQELDELVPGWRKHYYADDINKLYEEIKKAEDVKENSPNKWTQEQLERWQKAKLKAMFDKKEPNRLKIRDMGKEMGMPEIKQCHCGKDGHPLGSINCPVHGRKTRAEVIKILENHPLYLSNLHSEQLINRFVEAGLLQLREEPLIELIWQTETLDKFGKIRIEMWKEGLVIWVGGRIVWKSWEHIL